MSALNSDMPSTTWRHRWLRKRRIIAVLCCVVGLWLAWQVYDIFTGKPSPKVDYATPFYELSLRDQPDGEDGWPRFARTVDHVGTVNDAVFAEARRAYAERLAAERVASDPGGSGREDSDDALYYPSFDDVVRGPFNPSGWAPHLEIVEAFKADGTFDALTRLSRMSRCVRPRRQPDQFGRAPIVEGKLLNVRTLSRLLVARLRLAGHESRWDDFVRETDEALVMMRFVSGQPTIIEHLIALAGVAAVLREVRDSCIEFGAPEPACLELVRIIDDRLPLPNASLHIEGHCLIALDELQHIYTPSGRLPVSAWGEFTPPDRIKGPLADGLAIAIPGHETAKRFTKQACEEAREYARRPLGERFSQRFAPTIDVDQLPVSQVVLKDGGFVEFSRFILNDAMCELDGYATRLMLLIEAHRARHGAAPGSLDDLVPEYLDAVPIDPASGEGYGYRLLTDDPHGRTYLLYSFGVDGEDNGGHEEPMKSWNHPADVGVDYVINRPRSAAP